MSFSGLQTQTVAAYPPSGSFIAGYGLDSLQPDVAEMKQCPVVIGGSTFYYNPSANGQLGLFHSPLLAQPGTIPSETLSREQTYTIGLELRLKNCETVILEESRKNNVLRQELAQLRKDVDQMSRVQDEMCRLITQQHGQSPAANSRPVSGLQKSSGSVWPASAGGYEAVLSEHPNNEILMKKPSFSELVNYRLVIDGRSINVKISQVLAPQWLRFANLCNFTKVLTDQIERDHQLSNRIQAIFQVLLKSEDFTWKLLFEKIAKIDEVRETEQVQALAKFIGIKFVRM